MGKQRMLAILLCLMLLFPAANVAAQAQKGPFIDHWGDFEYEITEKGEARITRFLGRYEEGPFYIPGRLDDFTVTELADRTFSFLGDMLNEVVLPATITSLGEEVFIGNPYLYSFSVDENNPVLKAVDGVLFDTSTHTLLCYPPNKGQDAYEIPENTQAVAYKAFADAKALNHIILPASLTRVAEGAFYNTTLLGAIHVHPDNPVYAQIEGVLFDKTKRLLHSYPAGNIATSYEVPYSIEQISKAAFVYAKNLTKINLPETLTAIGEEAFRGCDKLKTIHIPASVIKIGAYAFSACDRLSTIYVEAGNPTYEARDGTLFDKAQGLLHSFPGGQALATYAPPEDTQVIGEGAFLSNKSLKSIILPESLVSIEDRAFEDCTELWTVMLNDGLTHIGKAAFRNCKKLSDMRLPAGLTKISEELFLRCSSLAGIQIPEGVETIEDWAFCACLALTSLSLPDSLQRIGKGAFAACWQLGEVSIPAGVRDIGEEAFQHAGTLSLLVQRDSAAAHFAEEAGIPYSYPQDWLATRPPTPVPTQPPTPVPTPVPSPTISPTPVPWLSGIPAELGNTYGNTNNGGFVVQRGNDVYFCDNVWVGALRYNTVDTIKPNDGLFGMTVLPARLPGKSYYSQLNLQGNSLYYFKSSTIYSSGFICMMDIDDGERHEVELLKNSAVLYLNAYRDWLYFHDRESGFYGAIMRMRKDGSNLTRLREGGNGLCIADDRVYCCDNGMVYSVDPDGSNERVYAEGMSSFTLTKDAILAAGSKGGIYRISIPDGEMTLLSDAKAYDLNAAGNTLFYLSYSNSDGIIYALDLNTLKVEALLEGGVYDEAYGDIHVIEDADNYYLYFRRKYNDHFSVLIRPKQ